MADIVVGLKGIQEMIVQRHHLASITGNIGASALSTHHVVLLMELAARNVIEGRLPKAEMTVGTAIKINHLAAAPLGAKVRAERYLKLIQKRN